ncbi:MAG TPA: EAL domain-containing protein [Candidatus Limnocylindrales bacterium]|jgi:diguanylate cyclase (GGDEF)-like protein|nr:EAL domain-containing protein [Candidatus Limnocylindrales bacterium]
MSTKSTAISRSSGRAIRRLTTAAFALHLLAAVIAVGALIALVGNALDPAYSTMDPVVPVAAATATLAVLVLGAQAIATARIRRHATALETERTDLREAYDRARLDSLRDGLTGLGNHRAFQEELDAQVATARDDDGPLALLIIDVDDLKKINDRKGHAAGDELLRAVAQVMRGNLRRSDRAYRIGGDEFALLLPGCGLDDAEIIANHLLAATLNGHHGRIGTFSVTIGLSAFPNPSSDRQQLLHHADAAMYSGKRHGRTKVERFDPSRHGIADDTRTLAQLIAAVERVTSKGRLRAVYQPIYSLRTGVVTGFEGLVRLGPEAEFDDPTALFVAAEATSRTIELDVVCAETVLANARDLRPDQYLSINLSPRTLESDAFSPLEVLALSRRHGVPPEQLVIELTEREAVEDLKSLRAAVATLRRQGVRIALDDIGAGNAGLRLLSEVDFDIMKIDLSLVRAGATHEPSEAVLRALGSFARQRGHMIVAEGIETPDLLEAVLELNYDAGQGYLFGRPGSTMAMSDLKLVDLITDAGRSAHPAA